MRPFKKPSEASKISEIATAGTAAQASRVDSVRYLRNQKGSYIQASVIGIDHALKGRYPFPFAGHDTRSI